MARVFYRMEWLTFKIRTAMTGAILLFAVAASVVFAAMVVRYAYDRPGDRTFVRNTNVLERWSPAGGNNRSRKIAASRAQM